jgi:hypothetical protein
MKEQRLGKKIESQSTKFKQRALKSPRDRKRHDRIEHDEQRCMQTAHKELGWSFAKIASVFDRDPRAVKKTVQSYEPRQVPDQKPQKQLDRAAQLKEHFSDLAKSAKILAFRVRVLLSYSSIPVTMSNNIVDGLFLWWRQNGQPVWGTLDEPETDGIRVGQDIDRDLAEDLLCHFNSLYPALALQDWKDVNLQNANQEVADKLSLLSRSKAFQPCLECEVCKALDVV